MDEKASAQALPEAHTDFVFSLRWESVDLLYLLLALVGIAAVALWLYARRRSRRN